MHLNKKLFVLPVFVLASFVVSANLAGANEQQASVVAECAPGGIEVSLTAYNQTDHVVDLEFVIGEAFGFAERITPETTATATPVFLPHTSLEEQVITGYLYQSDDYTAEPEWFEVVLASITCPAQATTTMAVEPEPVAATSTVSHTDPAPNTPSPSVPPSTTSVAALSATEVSEPAAVVTDEHVLAEEITKISGPREESPKTGHWSLLVLSFALFATGLYKLFRLRSS